jgi:hypothetical protein
LNLSQSADYLDTVTTIGILSWFYNPDILEGWIFGEFLKGPLEILELWIIDPIFNVKG